MRIRIILIVCIACLIGSCIGGSKITRRYKEMTPGTLATTDIEVNAIVQPEDKVSAPKIPLKTIFDLSPEGQAALFNTLGGIERNPANFMALLRDNLSTAVPPRQTLFFDLTRFNKTIIISTKKTSISDADRISRIDVSLLPNNTAVSFTGCDKIVTNYLTADLGSLKYTQVATADITGVLGGGGSASANFQDVNGTTNNTVNGTTSGSTVTTPVNGVTTVNTANSNGTNTNTATGNTTNGTTAQTNFNSSVTGKLGSSRTFSEEVALRQRYINLSAYIKNRELHFYQESISGIDVSGNIIAKVNLEFTGQITETTSFEFGSLFTAGVPTAPSAIAATQVTYSYPMLASDVTMAIKFNGVLRKVKEHAKTITESDDIIELKSGDVNPNTTVTLIKRSEFTPRQWYLIAPLPAIGPTLSIEGPAGSANYYSGPLYFNSYETAMEFYQYLQNNFAAINAAGLRFGPAGRVYTLSLSNGAPLNAAWVANMILQIVP